MKLYVGNLSKQITDAQLNDLAVPYGTLVSANVATERSSGESKGFGFIEYSNADEARAAITGLDGRDVNGQALKVNEAKPQRSRDGAALSATMSSAPDEKSIRRVALLGNHLPRQCGIATFTTDLSDAIASVGPDLDCFVLAMNDGRHQHAYPGRVRFELADNDAGAYTRAADFLNVNAVDVISRAARVRDLRRQGRQPPPAAAARAAHADRDDAAHDPRHAESAPAAGHGRDHRALGPPRGHDRGRRGAAPRSARRRRGQDRRHPARDPERAVRRQQEPPRRRRAAADPHLRPALARQGHRVRHRRAADDPRPLSRRGLHRPRRDASAHHRAPRRDLPADARGSREAARRRRQRDLSQPLRQPGRAVRVPRRGRHLHHAVSQSGADHLGHAGLRARRRKGRDLHAVRVCAGAARRRPRHPRAVEGSVGDRHGDRGTARRSGEALDAAPARRRTRPGHALARRRAFVSADVRARARRARAAAAHGVPRQHARQRGRPSCRRSTSTTSRS